jgi:phosphatidylinositol glycan class U
MLKWICLFLFAFGCRLIIYYSFVSFVAERVEVSTPVTSYKSSKLVLMIVKECLFLYQHGLDPYTSGGIFHQSPLLLLDFVIGILLAKIQLLRKGNAWITAAFYWMNPLSILSCVGQSTIIFTNVAIAFSLYSALKGIEL